MTVRLQVSDELVLRVVSLASQKVPQRAMARKLGVSRNTIKKILKIHAGQREGGHSALTARAPRRPRASKLDAFKPRVNELLDKYPNITAQRVLEILKEKGFSGGYSAVKEYVRKVRPKPPPKPSLETPDWGPGKMAESDWSKYDIVYTTGQQHSIQVFCYVLTHSTRKYYQAYDSNDLHALMDGHTEAFQRFGGCAERCKYDGQSPVARWEGNQPIYNPRFLAFCAHYEMQPWSTRGNPNRRPRVERSFWEHERSFLNGREFRDIEDLRAQLRHWLDTIVDHRKRGGTTAIERFAEEAAHLRPLPRGPYDTARVVYRVCNISGYVAWQGNHYAVPYDHVTDILPVRITQHELFVYAPDIRCIARHELAPRGAGRELDPAGFHQRSPRSSAVDDDQLRLAYEGMGPGATEFFRSLSRGPAKHWRHQARCILSLRERYATEGLDKALLHACRFGALRFEAVQRIVEARHAPRSLDEYVAQETTERLNQMLGVRKTSTRDLSQYNRIPGQADTDTTDTDTTDTDTTDTDTTDTDTTDTDTTDTDTTDTDTTDTTG